MAWRFHGHASIDQEAPSALGQCDRCSFTFRLKDLAWQLEWSGRSLINTRLLVCPRCLDIPNPQLRTLVLPPDPPAIVNARPEAYSIDETDYRTVTDGATRITEAPTDAPRIPENDAEQ